MVRAYLKRKARPIPPSVLLFVSVTAVVALLGWVVYSQLNKQPKVTDYESCIKAGNPVQASFPEQCVHNGQSFLNPAENIPKPY